MQLVNSIITKKNWQNKITNKEIVKKWYAELEKQNIKKNYLDLVLYLLKDYKRIEKDNMKQNSDPTNCHDYDWIFELGISPDEISIEKECECKCKICIGDEETSDSLSNTDIQCLCTEDKLISKRKAFLMKYVFADDLIDDSTKASFIKKINHLEKNVPVDYHPGSNDQIINLVHPSLFCYIKGVSEKRKEMNKNILFQWLPSNFVVKNDQVKINSYINNLDEVKYKNLYSDIAKIFAKFVPGFNRLLKTLYQNKKIATFKKLNHCQVIVKLANTVLTPDSPVFKGGSWHLEGLPHEKIIATGIYYYKMKNITTNYLNFRTTIDDETNINYPQNCSEYVMKHYGFDVDDKSDDYVQSTVVNLGKFETKKNTCLIFPNFLQHRVSEFELIDKTKKGYRKILVFFLIDPSTKILSTGDVKPQQNLMTLGDAQNYRELLMFQRKYNITDQNMFYERKWSLCEH